MISKIYLFLILLNIGFVYIQSQERNVQGTDEKPHILQIRVNKAKRELGKAGGNVKTAETKHINKRQTVIAGNGNRLQNLINLPVQLNVLANVLSKLNLGVLDSKAAAAGSNTISGNDNIISNLVNAPIDADAILNILSKVDSSSGGQGRGGLTDGVLGGGGGSQGLLGGLLGGENSGLLGSLLGNTLADLLAALLGDDGVLGNLLGGVGGKGLLGNLLNNLLGAVVQLVDNLLELLSGLLEALLGGMGSPANGATKPSSCSTCNSRPSGQNGAAPNLNIQGDNNQVNSLVNAPIRIKALINILSSLKQQCQQAMAPAA